MNGTSSAKTERPVLIPWSEAPASIAQLLAHGRIDELVDGFTPSVSELHAIERPGSPNDLSELARFAAERRAELLPRSVVAVFPWRRRAVHLPDPKTYLRLRTARNRLLVADDEQLTFRRAEIAVGGLSVGFSVLQSLVLGGGPRTLRIGDFDRLSIPNLNRLAHSVCDLGCRKTLLAARRVYELDPFADVTTFDDGVTPDGLQDFLAPGGRPVDLFFEEMDQLTMKIRSRLVARALRIPVVMVADLGDGITVDVERFDLEPDRPLLHGAVDEKLFDGPATELTMQQRIRIANTIVRPADMPPRLQESILAIGSQLSTWPQLGTAVALAGAAGAYVARRIVTGAEMPSGRYALSLDDTLDVGWRTQDAIERRASGTRAYEQKLGLRTTTSPLGVTGVDIRSTSI